MKIMIKTFIYSQIRKKEFIFQYNIYFINNFSFNAFI